MMSSALPMKYFPGAIEHTQRHKGLHTKKYVNTPPHSHTQKNLIYLFTVRLIYFKFNFCLSVCILVDFTFLHTLLLFTPTQLFSLFVSFSINPGAIGAIELVFPPSDKGLYRMRLTQKGS